MRTLLSIMVAGGLLAGPALAQDTPAAQTEAPPPKKERIICKVETALGTHMSKQVCKTWAEWRKQDDRTASDSRQFMDRFSDISSGANAGAATSTK